MADSATSRVTPADRARSTTAARSAPSAREFKKTADAPRTAAAAEATTSTSAGKLAVSGWRLTARTCAPARTNSVTSGRPTLPVAPVTTIVMM
jgi:hypothetical protein